MSPPRGRERHADGTSSEPRLSAPRGDGHSLVSVIVPVRNDAARVGELLLALGCQTLPQGRFEIVVGDDGSEDSLERLAGRDVALRIVRGPPLTSYAARNRAAAAARGSVLAFCDSDCLPDADWLEEGLAALENGDLAAGEVVFAPPARPSAWSLLTIDMFLDQERNVVLSRAVTANLFVRRELFEAIGGFDDSLPSGGDYDLTRRAVERGARLVHARRAVVRHPTIDSRRAFIRKVWTTNRWAAYRRARDGRSPDLGAALTFVPFLGVALARRHALRPVLHLQRDRVHAAGLRPGRRDELRALAALYLLVAYVAGTARLAGWLAWWAARGSPRAGHRHASSPAKQGAE